MQQKRIYLTLHKFSPGPVRQVLSEQVQHWRSRAEDALTSKASGAISAGATFHRIRSSLPSYRGPSLIGTPPPLRPYSRTIPRVLWWSQGGGCFS